MERGTEPEKSPGPSSQAQLEDYYAFRVFRKALVLFAFPAAMLAGVAGFFGYDLSRDVLEVQEQIGTIGSRAEALMDSLRAAKNELDAFAAFQKRQLELQSKVSSDQVDALIRQATVLGGLIERLEASREKIEGVKSETDAATNRIVTLAARLDAGLVSLSASQEAITAAQAEVDTAMASIQRRVFGSWSFVVHEKRRSALASLPLSIRMSTIRDGVLREFEVSSNGVVVLEAHDFPVGESRCVKVREGVWYRLTPSYIVELFLGADIAGLQVERLDDRAQCLLRTAAS